MVLASCSDDKSISPTPLPQTAAKMGADVSFADRNLELLVRWALKKPEGRITSDELAALNSLDANNRLDPLKQPIRKLAGIQHCTGLDTLLLWGHQITDISSLAGLTELRRLDLGENQVSDASPLASLTELRHLSLSGNQVVDLSPLSSLTKLTKLYLWGNGITDVRPLGGLTRLNYLQLGNNDIENVRPLNDLVNLDWLGLADNPILGTEIDQQLPALKKQGVSITKKHPGPQARVEPEPEPEPEPEEPDLTELTAEEQELVNSFYGSIHDLYVGEDDWIQWYEDLPGFFLGLPEGFSYDPETRRLSILPQKEGSYTAFYIERAADGSIDEVESRRFIFLVHPPKEEGQTLFDTHFLGSVFSAAYTAPAESTCFIEGTLPPGVVFHQQGENLRVSATFIELGMTQADLFCVDDDGVVTDYGPLNYNVIEDPDNPNPLGPNVYVHGPVGEPIDEVTLFNADEFWEGGPFGYSLLGNLPPGLTFDPSERAIDGTPQQAGVWDVFYFIRYPDGQMASYEIIRFEIESRPEAPLTFEDPDFELPTFTVGVAVAFQFPRGVGGVPPLSYSVVGLLPSGVSFDPATRRLSGVPTTPAGSEEMTFRVTDASGSSRARSFSVEVVEQAEPLTFEDPDFELPTFTVGVAVAFQFPRGVGGVPPLSYSVVGLLPSGVSFDAVTRRLSGVPTTPAGPEEMTFRVTDASGSSRARSFYVEVVEQAP